MSIFVRVMYVMSERQNTDLQAYYLMLILWYIPNLNYN